MSQTRACDAEERLPAPPTQLLFAELSGYENVHVHNIIRRNLVGWRISHHMYLKHPLICLAQHAPPCPGRNQGISWIDTFSSSSCPLNPADLRRYRPRVPAAATASTSDGTSAQAITGSLGPRNQGV